MSWNGLVWNLHGQIFYVWFFLCTLRTLKYCGVFLNYVVSPCKNDMHVLYEALIFLNDCLNESMLWGLAMFFYFIYL